MTDSKSSHTSRQAVLLKFLGSMNLAVTLLVALSVASIIGTVLQQNQPYGDYLLKFGPFWFEIFKTLGLFQVYSAVWFLVILAFLVLSTSVCIYRNMPRMFREMQDFRLTVQESGLRHHKHHNEWLVAAPLEECQSVSKELFKHYGFRTREKEGGDYLLLSAMKGAGSRWGYILTHLAIVLICVGGLMDGNVLLKVAESLGEIKVEKRNILASEVPDISRLESNNLSYRGNVSIPEGGAANVVFIGYKDGYLVQKLPFSIEVEDFRIEHYESGQPKSFESDLVIIDEALDEPIRETISVNHPLSYKGVSIYQASFGDGGSKVTFKAWPLAGSVTDSVEVKGVINQSQKLQTARGVMDLELNDFRLFNIQPSPEEGRRFHNIGPSVQFKLRAKTGEAKEYLNYMSPIKTDGRLYFMSGMRSSPAEPFQYLYLPADSSASINRFVDFYGRLKDSKALYKLALKSAAETAGSAVMAEAEKEEIAKVMTMLVNIYVQGGMDAVIGVIESRIPEDKREEIAAVYVKILRHLLGTVYVELLKDEGANIDQEMSEFDSQFFEDAGAAIGALERYGSPFYFQMEHFEHIQATGLQLTRSPGKNLVYPGCFMLALGVFLMFYMPQRRLWVWLRKKEGGVQVLLSGSAVRNELDFSNEYQKMYEKLDKVFSPHS